jgi:hypothetical protein
MNKIKSFEDACAAQGISTELPDVSSFPVELQKVVTAFYKLTVIAKAINKGWVADFSNHDQRKWFPWFYVAEKGTEDAGVAARYSYCDFGSAYSCDVSRLCFKTENQSDYAAETFTDLWNDYLLG